MPRCLMAKKWKNYPWSDRPETTEKPTEIITEKSLQDTSETEEEIDVVTEDPQPHTTPHYSVIQNSSSMPSQGEHIIIQTPLATDRIILQAPTAVVLQPTDHLRGIGGLHQGAEPCVWGPSSPTEGATAPSPPPTSPSGSTILYNGYLHNDLPTSGYTTFVSSRNDHSSQITYTTLPNQSETKNEEDSHKSRELSPQRGYVYSSEILNHSNGEQEHTKRRRIGLSSTGAVLSLPPKKKDIYRPYSLEDRRPHSPQSPHRPVSPLSSTSPLLPFQHTIRVPAEEDLHAAHAILDLSASTTVFMPPNIPHEVLESHHDSLLQEQENIRPQQGLKSGGKTIAYTYEAFFVSDGRSKKRFSIDETSSVALAPKITNEKPKYTCSECGKQYATSSNLSRHKQTHRSLDSQAAKKCMTCGKAYVSMPALAMHVLTHKLAHRCNVCGKQFSRPWLLQGHTRSHTGEKPYGCAHCGKAFADRSNLRAHMQTHSADKNFECSRCHKTFALKSYLNKHLESACLKEEVSSELLSSDLNVNLGHQQGMQTIRVYAG